MRRAIYLYTLPVPSPSADPTTTITMIWRQLDGNMAVSNQPGESNLPNVTYGFIGIHENVSRNETKVMLTPAQGWESWASPWHGACAPKSLRRPS